MWFPPNPECIGKIGMILAQNRDLTELAYSSVQISNHVDWRRLPLGGSCGATITFALLGSGVSVVAVQWRERTVVPHWQAYHGKIGLRSILPSNNRIIEYE